MMGDIALEVGMEIQLLQSRLEGSEEPDGKADTSTTLQDVDAATDPLDGAGPITSLAISRRSGAATGSPAVRNDPRTRKAAGNPGSRWRSLAPFDRASPINASSFMALTCGVFSWFYAYPTQPDAFCCAK